MTSGSGGSSGGTARSVTACSRASQPRRRRTPRTSGNRSVARLSRVFMEVTGASFDPQMLFDHPDPYPMFAALRASQPVLRAEFMNRTSYVLTKYDDCFAVLKDSETYSSRSN